MSRVTLEERVAALERQVGALLARNAETGRIKDWRRTRGAFTGDDLMKQVFEEGRKIRGAERKRARTPGETKRPARSRSCSIPTTFPFSRTNATRVTGCSIRAWKRPRNQSLAPL